MSRFTRRVAAVGAAALALGMGAGTTMAIAAPDTSGSAPSYAPAWLTLTTGATNQVRYVNPSKTGPIPTQDLKAWKACALTTTQSLLAITTDTPGSPGVGFAAGRLGVRDSTTSSGTSCSAVDAVNDESLTLKLGTVDGLVAASASLDINLKQNARILATATRTKDGTTTTSYYELQSGTNIGQEPSEEGATVFQCNNPSDSGPDSGANNNCRWEISGPSWTKKRLPNGDLVLVNGKPVSAEDGHVFDTLTLEAVTGSFSLMGGADGYVDDPKDPLPGYFGASGPSVFELVEGTVDCTDGSNTVNLRTSTQVPKSTWKRLGNLTDDGDSSSCDPYPYSATTGTNGDGRPYAQFNKPLDLEPNAQAVWETTFTYSGNVTDPIPGTKPALPKVYTDLDGDKNPDLTDKGEFELLYCDPAWTVGGVFEGPPNLAAVTNPYACLVSAVAGPKVGNLKSGIYTVYVYGDITLRR